jgi:hypothetical protein
MFLDISQRWLSMGVEEACLSKQAQFSLLNDGF